MDMDTLSHLQVLWAVFPPARLPMTSSSLPMRLFRSAHQFLDRASELLGERGKEYDSKKEERSAGKVAEAFNAITGKDLKASEVWLILQLLKDVRQWSSPGYHRDSAEDSVAYASLKAEALEEESCRGKSD